MFLVALATLSLAACSSSTTTDDDTMVDATTSSSVKTFEIEPLDGGSLDTTEVEMNTASEVEVAD